MCHEADKGVTGDLVSPMTSEAFPRYPHPHVQPLPPPSLHRLWPCLQVPSPLVILHSNARRASWETEGAFGSAFPNTLFANRTYQNLPKAVTAHISLRQ